MRIERLYNAIITEVQMDDIDKANLYISEKQFIELEAVYVYGIY